VDRVLIIHEGKLAYTGAARDFLPDGTQEFILRVRVIGDAVQCVKALLESPSVREALAVENDELKVRMAGGREDIAAVVETLVNLKQRPYQVSVEGKELEKVFLEVTGRNDITM